MTSPINIVSAEFKADPFPPLASLRAREPVYRTALPDKTKTPVWLLTRYEDVFALLKDERFVKNRRAAMTPEQLRKLPWVPVGSSRVDLQACKLEYSIVSPK